MSGTRPTIIEADDAMHKGLGGLSTLAALLQVMELAAQVSQERISRPVDIDWWGLISLAGRELESARVPLDEAEVFLRGMFSKGLDGGRHENR